jgi:hypothetical protein
MQAGLLFLKFNLKNDLFDLRLIFAKTTSNEFFRFKFESLSAKRPG